LRCGESWEERYGRRVRAVNGHKETSRAVETADDLIVWIKASEGKGLRLAQRKR
jgi:hypothetical protein